MNYTILKATNTLKAAESFVAKHYANNSEIVIETQGRGEFIRFVVVAY